MSFDWEPMEQSARDAVAAAFEKTEPRFHYDANRMLGEAMRQCKGKGMPSLVHSYVLVKVEEKIVELREIVRQQLEYVVNGPLGLHIGSRQDIDVLERTLVTRVYEHSLRTVDYHTLVKVTDEVIRAVLQANNIPDYRKKASPSS